MLFKKFQLHKFCFFPWGLHIGYWTWYRAPVVIKDYQNLLSFTLKNSIFLNNGKVLITFHIKRLSKCVCSIYHCGKVACKSYLSKLWPKQELYCTKFIVMWPEILSYVTQNFTMCNTQRKNDEKLKKKIQALIQPHPSLPKQAKG